jgi:ureidoglycolate hydrolase
VKEEFPSILSSDPKTKKHDRLNESAGQTSELSETITEGSSMVFVNRAQQKKQLESLCESNQQESLVIEKELLSSENINIINHFAKQPVPMDSKVSKVKTDPSSTQSWTPF